MIDGTTPEKLQDDLMSDDQFWSIRYRKYISQSTIMRYSKEKLYYKLQTKMAKCNEAITIVFGITIEIEHWIQSPNFKKH